MKIVIRELKRNEDDNPYELVLVQFCCTHMQKNYGEFIDFGEFGVGTESYNTDMNIYVHTVYDSKSECKKTLPFYHCLFCGDKIKVMVINPDEKVKFKVSKYKNKLKQLGHT